MVRKAAFDAMRDGSRRLALLLFRGASWQVTTDRTGPVLSPWATIHIQPQPPLQLPALPYCLRNKCSSCMTNVQNENLFHLCGKVYILLKNYWSNEIKQCCKFVTHEKRGKWRLSKAVSMLESKGNLAHSSSRTAWQQSGGSEGNWRP